jgi:two-component system OmpR family sensor kinase
MRILLVEDDAMIGEAVQTLLRGEGHAVDWVRDGLQADAALCPGPGGGHGYDMVLLDLGLPGQDGLQVLRRLRSRRDRTPVLVATARDAVRDRIAGLDAGADDYVVKPYDLDELLARLRALARRASGGADPLYEREGVRLNPATREASVDGRDVVLSGREWAVLEPLLARPGRTLSRQRGLHPRPAQEAGRGPDPQCARCRLHGAQAMMASLSPLAAWMRARLPGALGTRLLLFLGVAIVLTALLQGLLAYRNALLQTDTLFDYQMQQTAFALRAGLPVDARGRPQGTPPEDENHDFIVQVWTNEGLRIFESALGAALPQMAVLGFADVPARGTVYRVFSLQTRSQVIQVAQDMRVRRALARDAAWQSLLPIALLAPVLALAVWWVVRRSLAPVQRVRRELAARRPQDLAPVPAEGLPDEVRPLVAELNDLLQRVGQAFEAQQHFVADAAHELRSPLAALKLQLVALQRAPDAAAHDAAVQRLSAGIERATRLVEQLLALARQEAQATAATAVAVRSEVDLRDIVAQALADQAVAAGQHGLDMGLSEDPQLQQAFAVPGDAQALQTLVRNLLDNALKYVPQGGRVDVGWRSDGQGRALVVEDSGPGIAQGEREQVLRRFVRGPSASQQAGGSGLGLAIVQAIARQHGARLLLDRSPVLGGLRVQVVWPPVARG